VKAFVPLLAAGGAFTAAAIVGLVAGILAADRTREPLLAPVGLLIGAAAGGFSALRLLMRSLR
jgi:ABC-type uncharacterized transport system permease subunit